MGKKRAGSDGGIIRGHLYHLRGVNLSKEFGFGGKLRIFIWILRVDPQFLLGILSTPWFDGCDHTHVVVPRSALAIYQSTHNVVFLFLFQTISGLCRLAYVYNFNL